MTDSKSQTDSGLDAEPADEEICEECQGTRIVPDGAHYSGLGKDYGGMYCPVCLGAK